MKLSAITALSVLLCAATVDRTLAFSTSTKMPRTWASPSWAVLHATLADDSTTATKITTGPDGKAASNYDEDLLLTLQIIMDHQRRSATVSTEQLVQQVTAAAAIDDDATIDIRVPYDAAAQLAYDQEPSSVQSSTTFHEYKIQYEAKAVAHVMAKKASSKSATPKAAAAAAVVTKSEPVEAGASSSSSNDISIPYDAAAKLAYQALSAEERSKTDYNVFQQLYTQQAVADVIAKKAVNKPSTTTATTPVVSAPSTTTTTTTTGSDDVSVPYDAAAKLAFSKLHSIKHSLTYEQFQQQYEKNAVSNVIAKKLKREQQQQQASTK